MTITRDEFIRRLSEKSGYYMKDIKNVVQAMDEVVFDALCEATVDDDVQIQIVTGIKVGCKVVGERPRVNPKTQEPIVVGDTTKPFAKFSQDYRQKLQEQYDNNKNG